MRKLYVFLILLFFIFTTRTAFATNHTYKVYEPKTNKTYIDETGLYSIEEMKEAYSFSEKIKKIVEKKDINNFLKLMSFPVMVNGKYIENEQDFIKQGIDNIFTKDFTKNILSDEPLSTSYRGFAMNLGVVYFYKIDGTLKIYALNIH